jgi:GH15 family glucan-1,4-alpha-glucosidase
MGWVALDRASRLAEVRSDKDLAATWGATAAEIKDDILAHGVDKRGVLRQHYDTDALDASTLLAAIFGFLPHDDKRLRASVLTIADELTETASCCVTAPTRPTTACPARRAHSSSARSGSCLRWRSSARSSALGT